VENLSIFIIKETIYVQLFTNNQFITLTMQQAVNHGTAFSTNRRELQ